MLTLPSQPLLQTRLNLPNRRSGKVRDIYDLTLPDGSPGLLIVASDRISAFDVIMANGLPGKGVLLTQISKFWFDRIGKTVPHHLVSTDAANIPGISPDQRRELEGRVMIVAKANVVPIECVVRGYLAGSGWTEYQKSQTVCGIKLPPMLKQCDKLPQPIFTPATKEQSGHDINISFEQSCDLVGKDLMTKLRDNSIAIYSQGRDYAAGRGIILADTKFEWGQLPGQTDPILVDEVMTPDSSRFWPADEYQPGRDQNSFDKQIVRNYLQDLCDKGQWNKTPPGPTLPPQIVTKTLQRYIEIYEKLTSETIS